MGNVAGVMKNVNDAVSTEEMAKVMQQFAVENEKMGMSEEMMDDALIDAVRATSSRTKRRVSVLSYFFPVCRKPSAFMCDVQGSLVW